MNTKKIISWNVDTQYDFMRPDGKLYIPGAETIEPALAKLTQKIRASGITMVHTGDWHTVLDAELSATPDYSTTYPEHCMRGTPGAMHVPASAPKNPYIITQDDAGFSHTRLQNSREILLYKNKFDIFAGNPNADAVVAALNPDLVLLYGVATNVCDDAAVMGLIERGRKVCAITDAMKALPDNLAKTPERDVLAKWKAHGVLFATTDTIDAYLR